MRTTVKYSAHTPHTPHRTQLMPPRMMGLPETQGHDLHHMTNVKATVVTGNLREGHKGLSDPAIPFCWDRDIFEITTHTTPLPCVNPPIYMGQLQTTLHSPLTHLHVHLPLSGMNRHLQPSSQAESPRFSLSEKKMIIRHSFFTRTSASSSSAWYTAVVSLCSTKQGLGSGLGEVEG